MPMPDATAWIKCVVSSNWAPQRMVRTGRPCASNQRCHTAGRAATCSKLCWARSAGLWIGWLAARSGLITGMTCSSIKR
ncbi:hypothetical protein D3C71_1919350 [compost metagenome]